GQSGTSSLRSLRARRGVAQRAGFRFESWDLRYRSARGRVVFMRSNARLGASGVAWRLELAQGRSDDVLADRHGFHGARNVRRAHAISIAGRFHAHAASVERNPSGAFSFYRRVNQGGEERLVRCARYRRCVVSRRDQRAGWSETVFAEMARPQAAANELDAIAAAR